VSIHGYFALVVLITPSLDSPRTLRALPNCRGHPCNKSWWK